MRRWAPIAVLAAAAISVAAGAPASARPSGGELIEHQMQTQSSGMQMQMWNDLLTGRHRSVTELGGKPFIETVSSTVDGQVQLDLVSYVTKTWTTFTPGFPGSKGETAAAFAQRYRDGVAHGMYTIVGHDQIDGHDTVRLRHTMTMSTGTLTTDLWVDAFTYLPVRQRSSLSGMPSTSEMSYEWLPRTAENLVNLVLVVPDGFKHVQGQTGSSSCSSSSGSWLTVHLGSSVTTCSSQIIVGHS
jgi:hypothetical protein